MSLVAVIGAGITGLSVACGLKRSGSDVMVFEKEEDIGGVIKTAHRKGFTYELGPHSLQVKKRSMLEFVESLDLDSEIIEIDRLAKRYVVNNGKLLALPMGPLEFLKTPLFSAGAKLRILKELFTSSSQEEESIDTFIRRHFGSEVMDKAMDAFVSGVFAGDPQKLSVKHCFPKLYQWDQNHGSVLKSLFLGKKDPEKVKTRILSFRGGMKTFLDRIYEQIDDKVRLGVNITRISPVLGQWEIEWSDGGETMHEIFDHIVITAPSHALKHLPFEDGISEKLSPLGNIEYTPMAVITMAVKKKHIGHSLEGFGFLSPRKENLKTLGTLFVSSMSPSHAPKDSVILTSFIGGARGGEHLEGSDSMLKKAVIEDLKALGVLKGKPAWTEVNRWEKAIPQYNLGYDEFLQSIQALERELPGLHFAGNYRGGVGLPDCIENGLNLAKKLTELS